MGLQITDPLVSMQGVEIEISQELVDITLATFNGKRTITFSYDPKSVKSFVVDPDCTYFLKITTNTTYKNTSKGKIPHAEYMIEI